MPAHLLLWTLFSSAATVCLLNSLRSRAHHRQHESLQNQHTDKQAAGRTCFNVAEKNEKKREEEEEKEEVTKDDAEEDGKEEEEKDAASEEEQEGEIEEEVSAEETEEDRFRKRK